MAIIEVGRLCVKMAGRDAGQECVIIKVVDKNFVMIDGNTRRKRVNIDHLETLPHTLNIKEDATHEAVTKEMAKMGIAIKKRGEPRVAKETSRPIKTASPKKPKKGLLGKVKKAKPKKTK